MAASGSANFVVTLEETALTYTGPATAQNGQPLVALGRLDHRRPGAGHADRGPHRHLHAGHGRHRADLLRHTTTASGAAACTITVGQPVAGPDPGHRQLRRRRVLPDGQCSLDRQPARRDQLTITPTTGPYNGSTTGLGHAGQHLHQPARAERAGHLHARTGPRPARRRRTPPGWPSCPVTPNEPAGTYSLDRRRSPGTRPRCRSCCRPARRAPSP